MFPDVQHECYKANDNRGLKEKAQTDQQQKHKLAA
jgi:hypothetical protein